jgi:hypothetical protein
MKAPFLIPRLGYILFLGLTIVAGSLRSACAQNFILASQPTIGNGGQWMIAQDLNGDTKADFAVLDGNGQNLFVVTNNGDGSGGFTDCTNIHLSSFVQSISAADINGDSRVDLLTANPIVNSISVLTNRANGAFVLATNYPVGPGPRSVTAADFGRGFVDIVAANYNNNSLTVLTNNGAGVFGSNVTYNLTASPEVVIAADVNGDNKLDLIAGIQGFGGVAVLTNKGNGTFALSSNYSFGVVSPFQLAAVDLNGDHKLDVVVADLYNNQLLVLTNNGDGSFTAEPAYPARAGLISFAVLDAGTNDTPDIAVASYTTNSLQLLTNNGAGVFTAASDIAVPDFCYFLASADVNQNGRADLISAQLNFQASVLTNAPIVLPPMLSIQTTTTNSAILSWPLTGTNFLLQQNTNLSSADWVTVPNSLGTNQMILPRQLGSTFYRLKK